MEAFWMVWNEDGGAPRVKHQTLLAAKYEAQRLARANSGQAFHVLQLVGTAKRVDVEWIPSEISIPF